MKAAWGSGKRQINRGLDQSSEMRLIGWNANTLFWYVSTNLETGVNVPDKHKKVELPNKSTQSPEPERKQWLIVRPNRSEGRADRSRTLRKCEGLYHIFYCCTFK